MDKISYKGKAIKVATLSQLENSRTGTIVSYPSNDIKRYPSVLKGWSIIDQIYIDYTPYYILKKHNIKI